MMWCIENKTTSRDCEAFYNIGGLSLSINTFHDQLSVTLEGLMFCLCAWERFVLNERLSSNFIWPNQSQYF
jgi:hypothetical protein